MAIKSANSEAYQSDGLAIQSRRGYLTSLSVRVALLSSSTASSQPLSNSDTNHELSIGAKAAISAGCSIVGLILFYVVGFFCTRDRRGLHPTEIELDSDCINHPPYSNTPDAIQDELPLQGNCDTSRGSRHDTRAA